MMLTALTRQVRRVLGLRQLDAAGGGRRWADDRRMVEAARVIHADAGTIAARAQAFVMNNPHAARAVESLVGNLIGTGIVPRPQHPQDAVRRTLSALWRPWVDVADAEGRSDFYGLCGSLCRDMVILGEGLAVWETNATSLAPQLRRLHPEQLDRAKTVNLPGGARVVQGVEFSAAGKIVAYHIRPTAPGDALAGMPLAPLRLPASDVIHVFRPLVPGQVRGLSWFAPVLLSANDLAQVVDALVMRTKVSALHAGFVRDPEGAPPYTGDQTGSSLDVSMEPGALVVLPPGKDITFPEVPDAGNSAAFVMAMLRAIAAGIGVTYEQLTGDLSNVNYSSIRAGLLEFRRFAEGVQHHVIVFQLCRPVWDRWLRWQVLVGGIPAAAYAANRTAFASVKWLPPAWPWVDPQKDAAAAVIELDNLLRSRAEIVAERGYDVEELDDEIAGDRARAERLGIEKAPAAPAIPQEQEPAT